MLFYGWSCDRASGINGKSRVELPSPSEAICLPLNLMECGLLRSGLRLVRQTISSAQHSLAGHNEGIVASGRRIVHRYSSGKSRVASGRGYVDCKLRRLSPKCTMLEKEKCPKRLQCSDGLERRILGTWVVP